MSGVVDGVMGHRVTVAQLGSRMHYAIPRILHASGRLERFYTDICAVKGWLRLLHCVPDGARPGSIKRLLGRVPHGVPREYVTAFSWFGWEYARRRARARTPADATAVYLWAGATFCELVLTRGLGDSTAVYTFNSAGLEILNTARASGRFAVMEQTIAPFQIERAILKDEHDEYPGWQTRVQDDPYADEYSARERAEWASADLILCGSEFVKNGIIAAGGPGDRCRVIPYGVNIDVHADRGRALLAPIRVLTVGEVGLRKGSHYISKAAQRMKGRARFRMAGAINVASAAERELRSSVELLGPVPGSRIIEHFMWADVFLLPSLCEGSATVVYEALSCGLPVICTDNTGSVVRDGVDGFIVPVRDSNAIVSCLEALLADQALHAEMRENARIRANTFSLDAYSRGVSAVFDQVARP